jgi:FMN phosphatase YigB (HAD superfamily)
VIRAVLFDVDGTLYRQAPLRVLMAGELAVLPWLHRPPQQVPRLWKVLSAFRKVREELRDLDRPSEPLERLQYTATGERLQVPVEEVEAAVREWMFERPLKYLRRVARPGLQEVLTGLGALKLEIGVFSDYPVARKLDAMGIRHLVGLELEATQSAINAFKPHPQGFLTACQRWGLTPSEVVYVGDRPEVDAVGASAAGLHAVIVGAAPAAADTSRCHWARDLVEVLALIERNGDGFTPRS